MRFNYSRQPKWPNVSASALAAGKAAHDAARRENRCVQFVNACGDVCDFTLRSIAQRDAFIAKIVADGVTEYAIS